MAKRNAQADGLPNGVETEPEAAGDAEVAAPPKAEPEVVVEVLHPIIHEGQEFGRGIHKLGADVAKFFLALRVPNRVKGAQPVARIPLPAEEPKEGSVKVLPIEPPKNGSEKK